MFGRLLICTYHLVYRKRQWRYVGPQWGRYAEKIEAQWREVVQPDDLVLISGDISWALAIEHARII